MVLYIHVEDGDKIGTGLTHPHALYHTNPLIAMMMLMIFMDMMMMVMIFMEMMMLMIFMDMMMLMIILDMMIVLIMILDMVRPMRMKMILRRG